MKPLTNAQLAEISNETIWPLPKLFWRYEATVGLRALIGTQYTNTGRACKSPSDPDVAQMEVEYNTVGAELLSRIGKPYKGELADWESDVRIWELYKAAGAFGIPIPGIPPTPEQVTALKVNLQASLDALPPEVRG